MIIDIITDQVKLNGIVKALNNLYDVTNLDIIHSLLEKDDNGQYLIMDNKHDISNLERLHKISVVTDRVLGMIDDEISYKAAMEIVDGMVQESE